MARPYHFTLYDAVRHVLEWGGLDPSATMDVQKAIAACRNALQDLAASRAWTYYTRSNRLAITAPYSTGTIAYDHTGGSYERVVTLTSGTWPTWAARGVLVIDGVEYEVEDRKDDDELTLTATSNPGADVSSGTSYAIYRDAYELPDDFFRAGGFGIVGNKRAIAYLSPGQWADKRSKMRSVSGEPEFWTFHRDPDQPGRIVLRLLPYPSAAASLDYVYVRKPIDALIYDYRGGEAGVVTTSGTSCTGTDTGFSAEMAGCSIRLSYARTVYDEETDVPGSQAFLDGVLPRPWIHERRVTERSSATGLTLDEAIAGNVAGVRFQVSSIIDIERTVMMRAFLRCAERQLAILNRSARLAEAEELYEREINMASQVDVRRGEVDFGDLVTTRRQREARETASLGGP